MENRWQNAKVVFAIVVVQTTLYMTINHFPIFEPRELPLTAIDHAMPFWPWTLWIYFGFALGQIGLALLIRERALFHRAVLAYCVAMGATLLIHVVWPTYIVRPNPEPDGTFHTWAYRVMLESDAANSCFPSVHVCGPVVLFWAYWREGRRLGGWLLFLALPLMTMSILTTKQHYLWDLLGGYAMGGIGIAISWSVSLRKR